MSYDLYLRDPVDGHELQVPAHMMYGGNIACTLVDGQLVPTTTTEAYLNITYNYGRYYREAFPEPNSEKMPKDELASVIADRDRFGIKSNEGGIRSLNGLDGEKAVHVLEEMISRIKSKYCPDGKNWITTVREVHRTIDRTTGRESDVFTKITTASKLRKAGYTDEQITDELNKRFLDETETVEVNEGDGSNDYWLATAANAIRPLHQLIALSRMRPDGVWSEES